MGTMTSALDLVLSNAACIMGLYPRKDAIAPGSDADFTVLDPALRRIVRNADLRGLLLDSLALWGVDGAVDWLGDELRLQTADGRCMVLCRPRTAAGTLVPAWGRKSRRAATGAGGPMQGSERQARRRCQRGKGIQHR